MPEPTALSWCSICAHPHLDSLSEGECVTCGCKGFSSADATMLRYHAAKFREESGSSIIAEGVEFDDLANRIEKLLALKTAERGPLLDGVTRDGRVVRWYADESPPEDLA